jgi:hypothetical protein
MLWPLSCEAAHASPIFTQSKRDDHHSNAGSAPQGPQKGALARGSVGAGCLFQATERCARVVAGRTEACIRSEREAVRQPGGCPSPGSRQRQSRHGPARSRSVHPIAAGGHRQARLQPHPVQDTAKAARPRRRRPRRDAERLETRHAAKGRGWRAAMQSGGSGRPRIGPIWPLPPADFAVPRQQYGPPHRPQRPGKGPAQGRSSRQTCSNAF